MQRPRKLRKPGPCPVSSLRPHPLRSQSDPGWLAPRIWPSVRPLLKLSGALFWLCACSSSPPRPAEPPATAGSTQSEPEVRPPTARALCQQREPAEDSMIDDSQELLEETTCTAALWLDGLFGGERDVEAARETSGYLESSVGYSEFDGLQTRTRFKVDAELPNLKERASVFIGRDDQSDVERDRSETFAVRSRFQELDDDAFLAGFGYSLPDDGQKLRTDYRVGAANLREPRAFLQGRLRYLAYEDANDIVNLRATLFYNTRDGLGVTGGSNYGRGLGNSTLVRVANTLTVSQKTEGLDWVSALILYQNLRDERALAWETFIRGQTDEPEPLSEYGLRQIYRQPLDPRKLYLELLVGYTWPRSDPEQPREGSAEAAVQLELLFGRKAKR